MAETHVYGVSVALHRLHGGTQHRHRIKHRKDPEQPSETYRTTVREFARYRASHDLPLLPN
jgi:hypothetical protein